MMKLLLPAVTKLFTLQGMLYALYSWIDTINRNILFLELFNTRCKRISRFNGGVNFTERNGSSIKYGTGSIKHGMEVFEYLARFI